MLFALIDTRKKKVIKQSNDIKMLTDLMQKLIDEQKCNCRDYEIKILKW